MDDQIEQLPLLRRHIRQAWPKLRRSNRQLLQAAVDPKIAQKGPPWPVYVSRQESLTLVADALERQMAPGEFAQIDLRRLPADLSELRDHGLLYVPHDYIVPGGRFNELYGWDSYWIVLGLLHDGEFDAARQIVDNFLYEIEHYGAVLNANRTYYLSRSHPPFLTSMILAVFRATRDARWLDGTLPLIERQHRFWTDGARRTEETGLSRYYDDGVGPAPEVVADERDALDRTHYDRIQAFFRDNPEYDYGYDLSRFYDAASDTLTPLCYVADRAMRKSGFDPSDRFGQFNLAVVDTNPVCLNTLLCRMERETGEILDLLGHAGLADEWRAHAEWRAGEVNRLMWDDDAGLYFDYSVQSDARRAYPFLSTFYPLWAGIASEEQARRVISEPRAVRGARRADGQLQHKRQPLGRAIWLGAAAADRSVRHAPLRRARERRPCGARVRLAGAAGVPRAQRDLREVRRGLPHLAHRPDLWLRLQCGWLRLDQWHGAGPAGRSAARPAARLAR